MDEKVQAARLRLCCLRPYLSSMICALNFIETEEAIVGGKPTMVVDRWWRLYYHPRALDQWSVEELTGVLYHECGHLLRHHAARCQALAADETLYNVAGDIAINDNIDEEGIPLPKGALRPATFGFPRNLLEEEYYEMLQQKQPRIAARALGGGECGSCAHGKQQPWELGPPSQENPGISEAEGSILLRKVASEVQEWAKARGEVPGWWRRWAEEILSPQIPWQRLLAAEVRHACMQIQVGMSDFTYRRPSRRQSASSDVILPSLYQPVPNAKVVVDTSGSMSEKELACALAEVKGVLRALGTSVTIIACDAAVHVVKRVVAQHELRNVLEGGGGTDMGVGIEKALEKPKPDLVVVLTDGLTPWPPEPPPCKVIIGLLVDVDTETPKTPTWAKTVLIRTK